MTSIGPSATPSLVDQKKIKAILDETRNKLAKAGLRTLISSSALPGSDVTTALLIAPSEYGLQSILVALEDGKGNAYCDTNAFAAKVKFAVSELVHATAQQNSQGDATLVSEPSVKPKNHGVKWSEESDHELMVLWSFNNIDGTLVRIGEKLERSEVAIAARLVQTGLVENREEARDISRRRAALGKNA